MFHSTGMPFGLLIPMKPWKPVKRRQPAIRRRSLSVAAAVSRITGIAASDAAPKWAMVVAKREARRSSGKFANSRFFRNCGKKGPLFIMNMMTDGKWLLIFEAAAQNQMKHHVILAPAIQRSFAAATVMQTS